MDKEIELINSPDDKEFSEENISDTSYEEDIESEADHKEEEGGAGKLTLTVAHEAAKYAHPALQSKHSMIFAEDRCQLPISKDKRLMSNQQALRHLRELFSPEIIDIVTKSEERLLDLFEYISGDVLTIIISAEDEGKGSKILKGAYLLNVIKDCACINLRRESISRFLAKAFEFLLNFDNNYYVASKLVHVMNQYKFRHFDLSYVAEMYKVTDTRQLMIQKAFERTIFQLSNTKIGQETKNYVNSMMLKLLSKINMVFKDDFKELYKYSDTNNFTYLDENGVQFSYYFFATKYFNKDDFDIIMNEIMFYRTCDIRMKSKATVAFMVRAVKNKNFAATSEIMQRIIWDSHKLWEELEKDSEKNEDLYVSFMGYILAHILFSRSSSPEEFKGCVEMVKGFFEGIIDLFHPMQPQGYRIKYYKKLMSNFINTYCKQFKKCRENGKVDTYYIKKNIHPILKKITSFAVVGVYWDGVGFYLT